jgi:hypothetical protein
MMPWVATLLLKEKPDLKTGLGFYLYLCLVFPVIWTATCLLGFRRTTAAVDEIGNPRCNTGEQQQ